MSVSVNPTAPPIDGFEVTKSYSAGNRAIEILHNVSISVAAGEACAVMGPSGSGKSTLLYCLAGLDAPTSGSVRLNGTDLAGLSRGKLAELRRRTMGFVFQSYNLMPAMSAAENIALPFRLRGERPDRERIRAALAAVGLEHLEKSTPASLSGGEQQRVALARVIAQRPQIIFADEPTGALDTRTGTMVLDQLLGQGRADGNCALIVTHDPAVAAQCDRVTFMLDGRLERTLTSTTADVVSQVLGELASEAARRRDAEPAVTR